MSVDRVSGYPDYTQDGPNKNIPWAFSRKTLVKFYDGSVIPQITNTDYEGEIRNMGDKVIINTVPDILIKKYKKGQDVQWQDAESPAVTMNINRATVFAFKLDKIDLKQFLDKAYMDKCATDASEKQKSYIETEFLADIGGSSGSNSKAHADNKGTTAGKRSHAYNLGTSGSPVALTKTNILDKIFELSGVASEQNWPLDNRWIVLPSVFTVLLKQSDIKNASMTGDGKSTLRTGQIGMIDGWTIYSSNLYTAITDGGASCYPILFGHKSAISFATQLTEVEYFDKLETTFGKGMKGLQLYDWKTVRPESLGCLYAKKG